MKLLIASKNQGKIKEIKRALKSLKLEILSLNDFPNPPDFEEKAETFSQNAIEKAIYYNKIYHITTVADDSGLMVDYLNGAPGILSSRFAGPEGDDTARIEKLLRLLNGIKLEQRSARFHCAIALVENGRIIKLIEEEVKGYILEKTQGMSGFGYDPIFYYPPLQKSFAELSLTGKNKVSHRGKALNRLRDYLAQRLE